jgi:ADP-ribose pyrophosphatase YjhB (NUDIX family)
LNIIPKEVIVQNITEICTRISQKLGDKTRIFVSTIQDVFNPTLWSLILDNNIQRICRVNNINIKSDNMIGIGGRDSFIDTYSGRILKCIRFMADLGDVVSATQIRNDILKNGPKGDQKFLEGMIFQRLSQYATAYQTVDAAIMFNGAFLLGHREGNPLYRFIGGFSDPKSSSLEEDAVRETWEETHLTVANPTYISSIKVDDARYRNSGDCIKTALFTVEANEYGTATFEEPLEKNGFDDMPYIRWFKPEDINESILTKEHIKLYNILKTRNIL